MRRVTMLAASVVAVAAMSAATAGAALANTQPFYKVSGTAIKSGETKNFTAKGGESELYGKLGGIQVTIACKTVTGSGTIGFEGSSTGTLDYDTCEIKEPTALKADCGVDNIVFTFDDQLNYEVGTETFVDVFSPLSGKPFAEVTITNVKKCSLPEVTPIKGSIVAAISPQNESTKVGTVDAKASSATTQEFKEYENAKGEKVDDVLEFGEESSALNFSAEVTLEGEPEWEVTA